MLRDGPDVYTEGLCQTLTSTGATSWYVLDRLGSNTFTMNAAENVTDTQVFDGFGCLVNRTGTTTLPFGFDAKSGYETDSDTGLMLLGHRFYDPSIGRFLSRDPNHAGDNDYAYCGNEPVNAVDPSGESPMESGGGWSRGCGDENGWDNVGEAWQKRPGSMICDLGQIVDGGVANGDVEKAGTEAGNADAGHGSRLKEGGYLILAGASIIGTFCTDGAGAVAHEVETLAVEGAEKVGAEAV